MSSRIPFDEAKKFLEKGKTDGALLKNVEAIMGLVAFFAPLAVGLRSLCKGYVRTRRT